MAIATLAWRTCPWKSWSRSFAGRRPCCRNRRGRPPACSVPPGEKGVQTVTQGAAAHGLSLITWSVDPKDWATNDRDKVVQRVLDRVCDGDIILMHDMSDSSVDAALAIIDRLEEAGYRFVTVSELADLRGKTMEAGCLYTSFHPTFTVDAN